MMTNFTKPCEIIYADVLSRVTIIPRMAQWSKSPLLVFLLCFAALKSDAQSVGGTISGATVVCPATPNSGFLSLTGDSGTVFTWEKSTDGGLIWVNTSVDTVTAHSLSYVNITQATCYRVVVQNGAWPPDTSSIACISIYAASAGGTITGGGVFCDSSGTDTLFLSSHTGNVLYWEYSTNGGATWTNVADTTDTLIYPNLTQSTLYHAIVQNGAGCPTDTSSQASFVIFPVSVAGTISGNDTVCYGGSDSLMLSGNTGKVIYWLSSVDGGITWMNVADTNAVHYYAGLTQTTWFAVVVKSGTCSADTSSPFIVAAFSPTPVFAGNDTTIVQGQSITLNGAGTGTPLWLPSTGLSSATVFAPTSTPTVTTNYVLAVTDTNGCVNTDAVIVTIISWFVSNLFSPNADGTNDTWYIRGIQNSPDNEVFIYNIYGNEVYYKKGYNNDWKGTYNGSDLPDGTYYYVLRFDKTPTVLKGSVDILRSK